MRIYRFTAAVNDHSKPSEVLAEIAFHEYDVTSLSVRLDFLLSGDSRVDLYSRLSGLARNHLWLFATPPAEQSVEVLGIRGMNFEGGSGSYVNCAYPLASEVQIGLSEELSAEGRQICVSAQVVPGGIVIQPAAFTYAATGEVRREVPEEGTVQVSTSVGMLVVSSWIDTSTGEEHGNKTTTLRERVIVSGDLKLEAGTSLWQLNETFRPVLWDICSLLGFCYRCSASYYQISYWEFPEGKPPVEALVRRRIAGSKRRRRDQDELINFRDLAQGGLDRLYQAFIGAPARDQIERSISFLAAAYVSDDLAPAYFYAYAALETAVSAAAGDRAYVLGSSPWDRLRSRLEKEVDTFVVDEKLSTEDAATVSAGIKKKMPELRRIAVNERIRQVCLDVDVATEDLWPIVVGFESGAEQATTNRTLIVHAARADFPDQMNGDLVRLSVLTERIILGLLKWPKEKIWRRYDQVMRWLNTTTE